MPVQASTRPENIVGWNTYTTVAADRWIFSRNQDYTYIYNANEIRSIFGPSVSLFAEDSVNLSCETRVFHHYHRLRSA